MKKETILTTKICNENTADFNNEWFGYKQKSFISHVDTLYFMAKVNVSDCSEDKRYLKFIGDLRKVKDLSESKRDNTPIFADINKDIETIPFLQARMYKFHFGIKDKFDFFAIENTPNEKTPHIYVQIRSQSLWLDGIKKSFDSATDILVKILKKYEISIKDIQENRIDYAFHTNYIQDLLHFFPEKHLKDMQTSEFTRWHKEGPLHEHGIECDYFTLGRRKSNNVFFRVYNKSKEVVEMGYKQFFIAIWLEQGLISKFDEYVLKKAVLNGSWESKDKARCEFYASYGKDKQLMRDIMAKLGDFNTPLKWFTDTARGLVPDVTEITNIEFETKRKFYDRLKISIPVIVGETGCKQRMYNIIEQLNSFVNFLTSEFIRFVKYKDEFKDVPMNERPNADWWERLRRTKPLEYTDEWIIDYFRTYQINLDLERQKVLKLNKDGAFSGNNRAVKGYEECNTSYADDLNEFVSSLNDNDIQRFYSSREKSFKDAKRKIAKKQEQDLIQSMREDGEL